MDIIASRKEQGMEVHPKGYLGETRRRRRQQQHVVILKCPEEVEIPEDCEEG